MKSPKHILKPGQCIADLEKMALSSKQVKDAQDWREGNTSRDIRRELHYSMMQPKHDKDRKIMVDHLAKETKAKHINGVRHLLLHRGHPNENFHACPTAYSGDTHFVANEPLSYSTDKAVADQFSNDPTISAWVPETHISFSYAHAHKVPGSHGATPDMGNEGEVIVGPGRFPRHVAPKKKLKKSLQPGQSYEDLNKMAFGNIKAKQTAGNETWQDFDYSKVLPKGASKQGYAITVSNLGGGCLSSELHHDGKRIGSISAVPHTDPDTDKVMPGHLFVHSSGLASDHHGKGLGNAMYEALYHHAAKNGFHTIVGDKHTEAAERVHRSLARKHGIEYKGAPVVSGDIHDNYKYKLPLATGLKKSLESVAALLAKAALSDDSQVASVAVRSGNHLLMGKRRDNGRHTLPGGHLDKGEDRLAGAARELYEEAGIKVDPKDLKHLGSQDVITFTGKNKRIHAYSYEHQGEKPHTRNDPDKEVESWQWVPIHNGLPKEIAENLHSPKNIVLAKLGLLGQPQSTELAKGQNGDWKKEGYRLEHTVDASTHPKGYGYDEHYITAYSPAGEKVGHVNITADPANAPEYVGKHGVPHGTKVHPDHQRKGLATAMYSLFEEKTGLPLRPDIHNEVPQSDSAKALWSQPNRPFGKSILQENELSNLKKSDIHPDMLLDAHPLESKQEGDAHHLYPKGFPNKVLFTTKGGAIHHHIKTMGEFRKLEGSLEALKDFREPSKLKGNS